MAISDSKTRTLITLDKELKKELEEIAKAENRTFSNFVVTVLQNQLEFYRNKQKNKKKSK